MPPPTDHNRVSIEPWALGVVLGVISLVGLVLASRAQDDAFYATGLGLFVFGVLLIFVLIGRHVGRPD
ncbi:MAG: hypothetical protein ACREH6_10595 [Geminicoccaceae bacterium]